MQFQVQSVVICGLLLTTAAVFLTTLMSTTKVHQLGAGWSHQGPEGEKGEKENKVIL